MTVCRDVELYRHSELLYSVYSILTTKKTRCTLFKALNFCNSNDASLNVGRKQLAGLKPSKKNHRANLRLPFPNRSQTRYKGQEQVTHAQRNIVMSQCGIIHTIITEKLHLCTNTILFSLKFALSIAQQSHGNQPDKSPPK